MARIPVETILTARDVNTASTFRGLSAAADHYNRVLDHGIQAFSTFQTLALGGGVVALGAGLASTAGSLLKVNQELESTTNSLAGSIQVYKYARDYKDALTLADDALLKIKKDAADLPGTDTDFIRAFSITFPEQAALGVKTLDEAIKRSNNLTAVLLAKGVDSGQIGRDVGQMLRGHAGADVRSFMELKGQLGVKDAEEFNKKSAKDRLKLLDDVIAKNKDVIAAFGTTWDAVSSTAQSYLKTIVLAGSKPLFEEAKQNLKAMNDWLGPLIPKIERAMALGGSALVAAGRGAVGLAEPLFDTLAPSRGEIGASLQALTPVLDHLGGAAQIAYDALLPAADAVATLGSYLWQGALAVLPEVTGLFEATVAVGGWLLDGLVGLAGAAADVLGPILVDLAKVAGWLAGVLTDSLLVTAAALKPVFSALGEAAELVLQGLQDMWEWIRGEVDGDADSVSGFSDALAEAAEEAKKNLGLGGRGVSDRIGDWVEEWERKRAAAEQKRHSDAYKAQLAAAKIKRPVVNQDFRGSRFNIEQKFAPGYDPGRVLTAMRIDADRLARQRLSAGPITPLFGGG